MGRLDDAAKRKVVELREAGLSFRKIKAVLELENIKVSAQAIYLFLKEFNGRSRQNDLTMSVDSRPTVASGSRNMGLSEQRQAGWSEQQLRNLFRDAASFSSPSEASGQSGKTAEPRGQASGTGAANQERQQEDKKDEDVRIVSVTSLAQNTHHGSIQTARSGAIASTFARRRYTPSPANPVLVARKRLLDKALFHRARVRDSVPQSGQQTVSLLRRDQTCFPFSEGRKVMLPQTASYNSTTTRPAHLRGLHPGTNIVRQGFQQRANMLTQAAEQPPHVGIRLPVPGQSSAGSQNSGSSIRAQTTASQQQSSCQQSSMDVSTGTVSALQDQVKSLASEVRSIGLALRMMVEQQSRLEREQTQQTQVQKQILSTLQKLASKLEPCSLQLSTAPTVSSCPLSSASFSQSTLTHSQGNSLCSQAQSKYSEINGSALDSIEQFSLDSLSSATINGFQACNTADSLSFTQAHTPTFTQSHTQEYSPEMLNYMQPHTDSSAGMDSKPVEMASSSTDRPFQACMSSAQSSTEPMSVQNTELTIVKVENA